MKAYDFNNKFSASIYQDKLRPKYLTPSMLVMTKLQSINTASRQSPLKRSIFLLTTRYKPLSR